MWHGERLPHRTTGQSNKPEQPSALLVLTTKVIELEDEVKRLREWIEQAVDVWENCNHEDRTEWFDNFCEVNKE